MAIHRVSRRAALQLGAATAGAALLPVSWRGTTAQSKTLTFWNPGIFPSQDPNDKTKPVDAFYIYQAAKRFGDAHGVEVKIEEQPSDQTQFGKYRTASVAKNGPDVMAMWSGSYMLAVKEFLEPLGAAFSPQERARITGWETVTPDFKADSPDIYGCPCGTDGTTCIFYSKELFAKAGIDPESSSWPQNNGEFLKMLDTIKTKTGIPAITLDNVGFVWQSLAYWTSQQIGGAQGVNELVQGKRNFTDPELVAAADGWIKMAAYAVPGAESMDGNQAYSFLFQKQAAMTTAGSWIIGDAVKALGDDLGMVKIPDFIETAPITHGGIGGAGVALIVSNYSPNTELGIEFIKFLMSKDEQEKKAASGEGRLLNVTDVDVSKYYTSPLFATQQKWANEPSTIFWNDNVYPSELTTEILAQAQLAWTGQLSAQDFMAAANAKRDELLGS